VQQRSAWRRLIEHETILHVRSARRGVALAGVALERLTRSSRERMWAGVAGGMAEYFDLDPSLMRLIWVAAAVVSHGLAIPLYILAWIILPRDDRAPTTGGPHWRDWSQEFHAETQRLAEEWRRSGDETRGSAPPSSSSPSSAGVPAAHFVDPTSSASPTTPPFAEPEPAPAPASSSFAEPPSGPLAEPARSWTEPAPNWSSDLDQPRHRGGQPRGVGIVLVALGAFMLANNWGWFAWFNWSTMWPLIFIGLGVVLLARQITWNR
jgi:phage shock protein C